MPNEHLVVIGGVAAGLAAAMEARRSAPDLRITVLEKSNDISYGACGLPYVVSRLIPSLERLVVHTPDYFRERHNIDVRLACEAVELLPARSLVRFLENGESRDEGFSCLVIATGAKAICPPIPGHELPGVFVMRHLNDGRRLLKFMDVHRPRNALVVGAGYIGLEMAEAFLQRGLRTTIVEATDKVMSTIGGRARDIVIDELKAQGVEIVLAERAVGFEGDGERVARVITSSGRTIDADVVSIGVGVSPEVDLASQAGIVTGNTGAIVVDERQRTSAVNIYASGDCCEVMNRVSGKRVWHPLGQPAVKQGWIAGANAAGNMLTDARYSGVVGTVAVKCFGLEIARTGLSLEEALSNGFQAQSAEDSSASRAGYYPGGSKILTQLVTDSKDRLLGAQMVGREGVSQRINVYAAALHAGLKLDDVSRFDLAYAPPFAPTIDPILRSVFRSKS